MLFTYNGQIDPATARHCYAIFSNGETAYAEEALVTGRIHAPGRIDDVRRRHRAGGRRWLTKWLCRDANTTTSPPRREARGRQRRRPGHRLLDRSDAQALTINRTTDNAIVRLDQKTIRAPGIWTASTWSARTAATSPRRRSSVPSTAPRPQPLTLDFGASEIPEGTVGIRFDGDLARSHQRLWQWCTVTFDVDAPAPTRDRSTTRRTSTRCVAADGPALP